MAVSVLWYVSLSLAVFQHGQPYKRCDFRRHLLVQCSGRLGSCDLSVHSVHSLSLLKHSLQTVDTWSLIRQLGYFGAFYWESGYLNALIKSILLQPKVKTDSACNVEWEIQLWEIKTLLFIADPVFHVKWLLNWQCTPKILSIWKIHIATLQISVCLHSLF